MLSALNSRIVIGIRKSKREHILAFFSSFNTVRIKKANKLKSVIQIVHLITTDG